MQKAEYKASSVPAAEPADDSKDYSEGKYGAPKMIQVNIWNSLQFENIFASLDRNFTVGEPIFRTEFR